MKVFGRAGLFNVVQRTQAAGQSTMHIIEGDMEVKRNGEQGVDLFKFQIESFGQKQIDYRSQKFINNASVVFTGDLCGNVIKIRNDIDFIGTNHFFSDNTKAMMGTVAPSAQTSAPAQQYPNYGGFIPPQQAVQEQNATIPYKPYAGYNQSVQQAPAAPVQNMQPNFANNPQEQQAQQYGQQYNNAPVPQVQQYNNPGEQTQQNVPQFQQQHQQNNQPQFANPNMQNTAPPVPQQNANAPVNYADLFAKQ